LAPDVAVAAVQPVVSQKLVVQAEPQAYVAAAPVVQQVGKSSIFFLVTDGRTRDRLAIPECKQNMMLLRGQASWAKMMSLRGKLTALACHLTKFVNKAE